MRKEQINKLIKYSEIISKILEKIDKVHADAFNEHHNKLEKEQKITLELECIKTTVNCLKWAISNIKEAKDINEDKWSKE